MTPGFARFASNEKVADEQLAEAVQLAEGEVIDADFGDGVIRQWIAHPHKGPRTGIHTLIAYRPRLRAVYLHAFAKNGHRAIKPEALHSLRLIAGDLLAASSDVIEQMMYKEKLIQVDYDQKET